MPGTVKDKAQELWKQVQGVTGDVDPALIGAGVGAVGGGVLGMLSGSRGSKEDRFGRMARRTATGAVLGASAGGGMMLLKKILDHRLAVARAKEKVKKYKPVSMVESGADAVANVAGPVVEVVKNAGKKVAQVGKDFWRDIHSTQEDRDAYDLAKGGMSETENTKLLDEIQSPEDGKTVEDLAQQLFSDRQTRAGSLPLGNGMWNIGN